MKKIIITFLLLTMSGCCALKKAPEYKYYDSIIETCCDSCDKCTKCFDVRGIK